MRCQVWPLPVPPQTFILWSYGGGDAYPVMSRAKAITPVKSSERRPLDSQISVIRLRNDRRPISCAFPARLLRFLGRIVLALFAGY